MKEATVRDLLRAIRAVCKGNYFFSAPIAERLMEPCSHRKLQSKPAPAPALTRRQTEVLQLIAGGCSGNEIARQLSLSGKTVEKHRQAVMDKLGLHKVAALTRYAVSSGVVELHPLAPVSLPLHRPHSQCFAAHRPTDRRSNSPETVSLGTTRKDL